jgi:hypothetical protein
MRAGFVARTFHIPTYNALLFSLRYPANWTPSQAANIKSGTVTFQSDTDQATAWVSWNPKSQGFSVDKE